MRFKHGKWIILVSIVNAQNYGFIKCTQGCIRRARPNNIMALYQCQQLCQIRIGFIYGRCSELMSAELWSNEVLERQRLKL